MKRVLVIAASLCAALFGLISAARAYGTTHPLQTVSWFTLPDGSECPTVCLFGLQPGMPFDEALKLIRIHPTTRTLAQFPRGLNDIMIFRGDTFELVVERNPSRRELTSVTVARKQSHQSVLLEDVTARYGVPTHVMADPASILISFYFPDNNLHVITIHSAIPLHQHLQFASVVHMVALHNPDLFDQVVSRVQTSLRPWRGYTRITRYY